MAVVVVGFHRDRDAISCQLARGGVRRGAADASGGVQRVWAYSNAIVLTSILDRQLFVFYFNVAAKNFHLSYSYSKWHQCNSRKQHCVDYCTGRHRQSKGTISNAGKLSA